jgi:hypothetical protein
MLHASGIQMNMLPFPNRRLLAEYVDHRRKERSAVSVMVELKTADNLRVKVALQDLSASGCQMRTADYMCLNQRIYLTLPGFESLAARIAWNAGELYGCEFLRPLHDSIFAHIAAKYPVLVVSDPSEAQTIHRL